MQTERLRLIGMTSSGCANVIAAALKRMGGVREVAVSYAAGDATVKYDESLTSPDKLKLAVMGAGYVAERIDALN